MLPNRAINTGHAFMDRWGFSEDCPICGESQSYGHFAVCPVCRRAMCHLCIHNHDCHDIYTEESANEAYAREKEEQE